MQVHHIASRLDICIIMEEAERKGGSVKAHPPPVCNLLPCPHALQITSIPGALELCTKCAWGNLQRRKLPPPPPYTDLVLLLLSILTVSTLIVPGAQLGRGGRHLCVHNGYTWAPKTSG